MPFYEYYQINSGGSWDEDIGYTLFVEAETADEADHRAESVGVYFSGCDAGVDCPCCGDRWSRAFRVVATNRNELRQLIEQDVIDAEEFELPITVLLAGETKLRAFRVDSDLSSLA